jgi:purine-binding chemotaxis protein CheW
MGVFLNATEQGFSMIKDTSFSRSNAAAASLPAEGEYLSFRLGAEEYGISLLKVQEIRSYEAPTRIANAPPVVKGVLNLRGVIMPVADLRIAFGCEHADLDAFTVVIVLNVCDQLIGGIVDAVSDVVDLPASAIRPVPDMTSDLKTRSINGIASLQDRTLLLLDIEVLMASSAMGLVRPPTMPVPVESEQLT